LKSFARYLVITFWERIWTRLLFYGDFFASVMKFVMVRRVYNVLPGLFSCVYLYFLWYRFQLYSAWLVAQRTFSVVLVFVILRQPLYYYLDL